MFDNYVQILRNEFRGYNADRLAKDFSAGMTVAAVALPLALAFGVGSGADAAAGNMLSICPSAIITAIPDVNPVITGAGIREMNFPSLKMPSSKRMRPAIKLTAKRPSMP